ncbi:MAG: hypothetical protein ABIG64_07440 [Candidatus Omnitrophota bacterium]
MHNSQIFHKKIIQRIFSVLIISVMLTSNIAWAALDNHNVDTLAPALNLKTDIFQQGVQKLIQDLSSDIAVVTDLEKVKNILSDDPNLANNPTIIKMLAAYEQALEFNSLAMQQVALAEQMQAIGNFKSKQEYIERLKMIESYFLDAIKMLDLHLNNIEKVRGILPEEKNQVLYEIARLGAEICASLADFYSLNTHKSNQFWMKAEKNMAFAFSLSNIKIDFYALVKMATIYGKLSLQSSLKTKEKINLVDKSIAFFKKAEEQIPNLAKIKKTAADIADMYSTFCNVFHAAAFFAEALPDYDKALRYYDQAEKLIPHFIQDKSYLAIIKKMHKDYYNLVWDYASALLEKAEKLKPEEQEERKKAIKGFFHITSRIALKYLSYCSKNELTTEESIEPLSIIVGSNLVVATIELDTIKNISKANQSLRQAADNLTKVNQLKLFNPFDSFNKARLYILFITQRIQMLKQLILSGEVFKNNFKITEYLEPEFFGEFISRYEQGEYKELFRKIHAEQKDPLNLEKLSQQIYLYSIMNSKVLKLLQECTDATTKDFQRIYGDIEYEKKYKEFKQYRFKAAITAAGLYVVNQQFKRAQKCINVAVQDQARFISTDSFHETILPQLILAQENGLNFLVQLLSKKEVNEILVENFISHKHDLTQEIITFFTQVLDSPEYSFLLKQNHIVKLIKELELPLKVLNKQKQDAIQSPQTDEMLITAAKQAIEALNGNGNGKTKKKKQKKIKGIDLKTSQGRRVQNALTVIIEKVDNTPKKKEQIITKLTDYMQTVVNEALILKQANNIRMIAEIFVLTETNYGLEVLRELGQAAGTPAIDSLREEINQSCRQQEIYLNNMVEVELIAQDIIARLAKMDTADVQADNFINGIEQESQKLQNKYSFDKAKGSKLKADYQAKITQALISARQRVETVKENKISVFERKADRIEGKLKAKIEKIINKENQSNFQKYYYLKQWWKTLELPYADEDIKNSPRCIQAQEKINSTKTAIDIQVNEKLSQLAKMCKGGVVFGLSDDFNTLTFEVVKKVHGLSELFAQEAEMLIPQALESNPQVNIIALTPTYVGFIEPTINKWQEKLTQARKKQQEVNDFINKCSKKEEFLKAGFKKIVNENKNRFHKIELLNNFFPAQRSFIPHLDEDINADEYPEIIKAVDSLDSTYDNLLKQKDNLSIICFGKLRIKLSYDPDEGGLLPEFSYVNPQDRAINIIPEQIAAILDDLLEFNPDVDAFSVGAGISGEEEWVIDLADIFDREKEKFDQARKKQQVIHTKVSPDTQLTNQCNVFIQYAI